MNPQVKMRLKWVQLHQTTQDAGLVCRRCGISRLTLRKWVRRYHQLGLEGLKDRSRRPQHCPPQKVFDQQRQWVLQLRQERKLGARRIQSELRRLHNFSLSLATIHKVLTAAGVKPLKANRLPRKGRRRDQKEVPGEQVQMDVCKIAPQLYQYIAIDDCTRLKVIQLYPNKQASSTLVFRDYLLKALSFPVQRLQTDRGKEFMAFGVQRHLMELGIKFRPVKPRSPHLNAAARRGKLPPADLLGKVERTRAH